MAPAGHHGDALPPKWVSWSVRFHSHHGTHPRVNETFKEVLAGGKDPARSAGHRRHSAGRNEGRKDVDTRSRNGRYKIARQHIEGGNQPAGEGCHLGEGMRLAASVLNREFVPDMNGDLVRVEHPVTGHLVLLQLGDELTKGCCPAAYAGTRSEDRVERRRITVVPQLHDLRVLCDAAQWQRQREPKCQGDSKAKRRRSATEHSLPPPSKGFSQDRSHLGVYLRSRVAPRQGQLVSEPRRFPWLWGRYQVAGWP